MHNIIRITEEEAYSGSKIPYIYTKQDNTRDLLITLPKGIKNGQKIKLRGLGEAGKNGGDFGRLYLKVNIRRPFAEIIREFVRKLLNYLCLK